MDVVVWINKIETEKITKVVFHLKWNSKGKI